MTAKIAAVLLMTLVLLPFNGFAQGSTEPPASEPVAITLKDPVKMLQQTTDEVLKLATAAKNYAEQDPERYHRQVEAILERVVDVDYFTRAVMGTYGSGRLYKSLETDEERRAFKERVKRFAETLKSSFMVTYADALLAFDGVRVELQKPEQRGSTDDNMMLAQTIYGDSGTPYNVQYRLRKNREGNWQVYNVIVEGVNMGETYRNQFARAVEQHGGDVDHVVNHWDQIMSNAEQVVQTSDHKDRQ